MKLNSPFVLLGLAAIVVEAVLLVTPGVSAQELEGGLDSDGPGPTDGVVAFYFHGNARCATCRKIEAYSDEAVRSAATEALADGALSWRVVNVDEPENRHFIEDFQLVTKSVVLAEYRDGEVVRFKNLDKVWQLVRSKDDFVEYVKSETREFLTAS
jgi:hypothetical protein